MRVTSEDILNGPVAKTLWRMTLPMVVAIFMMIFFQAVDTYFVSMLGTIELAAISFTFPVTLTIANCAIGLSIGTSVLLAKVIGQGDHHLAQKITSESLLFSILIGLLISALGFVTIDILFRWLGATANTLPFIHEYMDIWYLCATLFVVPMVTNGAIRATGDTRVISLIMIASGFINAVLDPFLIFGLGPFPELGVKGAAIATAIAWLFSFIASIYILRTREKLLVLSLPPIIELLDYWKRLCKVAIPISLANMLTPIALAILTAFMAQYGEKAVAAFGAGSRIEAFTIVIALALTSALSPYMAQNLGAQKYTRARTALNSALRFAFFFHLGIYPFIVLSAPWLANLFSQDPEVIEITKLFLWIMPIGTTFYGVLIVMNTAFNAAHQSNKTLIASLVRVFLCYAPGAWVGSVLFGIPGLYTGAVIGNGIAMFITWRMVNSTYDSIESGEADMVAPDTMELNEIDDVELKSVQVD